MSNQPDPLGMDGLTVPRSAAEFVTPVPRPTTRGILRPELQPTQDISARLSQVRARLTSEGIRNLQVAESSMHEVKELQEAHTVILNDLSAIRKRIASDLSILRSEAARAKKAGK